MPDMHIESLLTGIGGSAVTGIIFRILLQRTLNDLDSAVKKIGEISHDLARISTRLETIERVVKLEARLVKGDQ